MSEHAMPLANILTRRLVWIAVAVLVVNAVAVGIYYGSDRQALEGEVIERVMEQLEADLASSTDTINRQTRALFQENPQDYGFAVIRPDNTILDSENRELIPGEALDTGTFAQDWLTRQETARGSLLVASHKARVGNENLRLVFVMADDPVGLLWRALVAEFVTHIWLPILPTALILIAVNALMIRRGIRPVVDAARWARSIKPGSPAPPLQGHAFPREIVDLVTATHRSLERLNEALASEKRRTAEAAHALRTPVSVLFARLDGLPAGAGRDQLKADLTHLSRTVNQLLACARADELTVPDSCRANLGEIASKVTAALAPFAYENGVILSLSTNSAPVIARADSEAVELALTNLVENAILHGGRGEVEIFVNAGASITVCDQGPGLSSNAMARAFELFWRGEGAAPGGAGLGLAIVARLQRAQGGGVNAANRETGGAQFTLSYTSD
jgi:two-component system OmpR family sensor kinase